MTISCDDRDPLELLAQEFLELQRSGRRPTIADFAARYPEQEFEIRELFPAILAMERLKAHCDASQASRVSLGAFQPDRLGEFRLLNEIGRGGMGVVYEAEHESLGHRVAIKVLPKQSAKQFRLFRREARTAARLHHPNIVPLHGIGEHDGYHYIVMQLIQGVDLEEVLTALKWCHTNSSEAGHSRETTAKSASEYQCDAMAIARELFATDQKFAADSLPLKPTVTSRLSRLLARFQKSKHQLPSKTSVVSEETSTPGLTKSSLGHAYFNRIASLGRQAAEALEYAHSQQTQHRDIKPANLLLDARGVLWITDFGLAKAMDDTQGSQGGHLAGTLRYMAPEQFSGQSDHRVDIYSLGLTLYELLTLKPAFADASRTKLIRKIMEEAPPAPRRIVPQLPVDLETILLKAIARDPVARYQSAGDLARDLQRFVEDKPVSSRPLN